MARVKRGVAAHQRHKAVLKLTKGQRMTRHRLYRRAHEAMMHSLRYATTQRRDRKGDMRKLWIMRINAGARAHGLSYSRFVEGLQLAGIAINRKMLAELAVNDQGAFGMLVEQAKAAAAARVSA